jgi:hypothetical protein
MSIILPDERPAGDENGHAPSRLVEAILSRSVADNWQQALQEWWLESIYFTHIPTPCLCGHPSLEHCLLVNRNNGRTTEVGNLCVTRFMNIDSERLFRALRQVRKNRQAALNPEVTELAHEMGLINDWERMFSLDTCHKPTNWLSPAQLAKRVRINQKVIRGLTS